MIILDTKHNFKLHTFYRIIEYIDFYWALVVVKIKERKGKQRKGTLINNCCATVGAVHALGGSERKAFDRCTDLIPLLPVAVLGMKPKAFLPSWLPIRTAICQRI